MSSPISCPQRRKVVSAYKYGAAAQKPLLGRFDHRAGELTDSPFRRDLQPPTGSGRAEDERADAVRMLDRNLLSDRRSE
jgi:hypothetical protein